MHQDSKGKLYARLKRSTENGHLLIPGIAKGDMKSLQCYIKKHFREKFTWGSKEASSGKRVYNKVKEDEELILFSCDIIGAGQVQQAYKAYKHLSLCSVSPFRDG